MQTPTAALNQALAGLSKVGVPFLSDEGTSSEPSAETASPSFRDGLMDEILAEHPGLTREKLSRQMEEMGF